MVEKDVTHPRMKRRIENPRIILLDCPLEYKKAESATNLEVRSCGQALRACRGPYRAACRRCKKRSAPVCAAVIWRVPVHAACPADETLICAWTELRS